MEIYKPMSTPIEAEVVRAIQPAAAGVCLRYDVPAIGSHLLGDAREQGEALAAANRNDARDKTAMQLLRWAYRLAHLEEPQSDHDLIRAASMSGVIADVFSPVFQGAIRAGFLGTRDTTTGWTNPTGVKNFKDTPIVLTEPSESLLPLARNKAAEMVSPAASANDIQIGRFARQARISEEDFLDDAISIWAQTTQGLGRAARRLQPDLVYTTILENPQLADGTALFHSSRGNILTGASSALSKASLASATKMMADQRREGVILGLLPKFLIVPPALFDTARELCGSFFNPELADDNLVPLCEPRLGAGGFKHPVTGATVAGTDVNWMLAARHQATPTIAVGFLSGSMESATWMPAMGLDATKAIAAGLITGSIASPKLRSGPIKTGGEWGMWLDISLDIGVVALSGDGLVWSAGA